VEGFVAKALKARLQDKGAKPDGKWASIRLLQECLVVLAGINSDEAVTIVEPLQRVHFLRTKLKGHLAETDKQALIKAARGDHGSLAKHFRKLAEDVQISFNRIAEVL
jgi:hypothetical protein